MVDKKREQWKVYFVIDPRAWKLPENNCREMQRLLNAIHEASKLVDCDDMEFGFIPDNLEGRDIEGELVRHSRKIPDDVKRRCRLLRKKIGLKLILSFLKELDEECQRKIDENWRIIEENNKKRNVDGSHGNFKETHRTTFQKTELPRP